MKIIYHFVLLALSISGIKSSIYTNLKDNVVSLFQGANKVPKQALRTRLEDGDYAEYTVDLTRDREDTNENDSWEPEKEKKRNEKEIYYPITKENSPNKKKAKHGLVKNQNVLYDEQNNRFEDLEDAKNAKSKSKILQNAMLRERKLNDDGIARAGDSRYFNKEIFHMDPVLNVLRSQGAFRRTASSDSDTSSSSRELRDWKDEWKEHWAKKKMEAMNATGPKGDVVNMVAARPWGVPCGDPNQHDMPWGSCMLSIECESEYRIYRGDFFCGRTQFVCCALQLTSYDLYQGFDASFDDKSLSTDSEEKRHSNTNSKEHRNRKRRRDRRKRKKNRLRRKRKIKRNIKKIVKEIRKILNRQYRNGTRQRKKKTKMLKKFVKHLKKQFKKDRQSVKDLHEDEIIRIDIGLMSRLNQIRDLNKNFMRNATFRDIVVNGTVSKAGARMLVEAYPELAGYLETRRSGRPEKPEDYLEYDIEYGYLYY